ncbi:hypothetical protein PYW07_016158 [Mythimna separata]|uniref:Uncharacterized protein n=1 Tax=Mythimna separata TaxID=271217 RepID=A0AAD8DV38_MYTSE|nr:hypothetical protein PYW07_016158 [Mythimna separata]
MSELLIVFALLAVGKIHGQETVVSQVTNHRPLHVPAFDRRPVPYQEREYSEPRTSQPLLRLYTNPPRPAVRDVTQKPNGNSNLNLLPPIVSDNQTKQKLYVSSKISVVPNNMKQPHNNSEYSVPVNNAGYLNLRPPTVSDNQSKRKLFLSSKILDNIKQPYTRNDSEYSDPVNNAEYISNDVYEDITFVNNRTPGYVVKPAVKKNTVTVKSENVTTVKPALVNSNILNNGSVPEITLDERSSFNGDACPTGFAKVNGVCVKADQ